MKTFFGSRGQLFFLLCLVLIFLSPPFAPDARADGGAPNLSYVSGTSRGISIIDIAQQRITDTFSVPGNPATILLSTDGRLLYVTQPALNRIAVIATYNKQTLCSSAVPGQPTLLTLDPGTNTLYAAGAASNQVTALDPMTCTVRQRLKVHDAVTGLAIAIVGAGIAGGNDNQLWVADTSGVSIFQTDGKQLARVPLQVHPQYLCIPPGASAYVTTQQGDVEAIDLKTRHISPPLLVGGTFGPMDYDAVTGEIYVPDLKQHRIDVLGPVNVATSVPLNELRRTLSFPSPPQSVAITSDGQFGFIALGDGSVAMLDVPGHQIITNIRVGGHPRFIITGLYPSLLSFTPQQTSLLNILMNFLHYAAAAVILIVAIVAITVQRYRQKRRSGTS